MYFPPGPNLLNLDALGSIYLGVLAQQTSNDANGNPVTSTLWGALCQISGDVANPPYSETQLSPPSPPLSNGGLTDDFFFLNPDGGNANAYCAGAVGEINVTNGYCQLLYSQGSFTIFDFTDDIGIPPTVTGNNAISDADFWPTMCNAQGQAIDNIDDLLWDGTGVQTPPSRPVALNDQYDVLCAADLCTNGVTSGTNTTLAGKVPAAFAAEVQNLKGVAVSNRNTAATGQQPLLNVVASGNIDRSGKGTNWQPTQFLFQELANNTWTASEIPNSVGLQVKAINSSGVIAAIGNPPGSTGGNGLHALLLLPVQLTNKADPTIRNGANGNDMPIQFLQSSTDTNIGAVAWIAGNDPNNSNAPRMPHLQAQIGGPNGLPGTNVYWKLQVTFHDRFTNPHRDFDTGAVQNTAVSEDTVTIPIAASLSQNFQSSWHKVTDGTPWNIYEDPDWQEEVNDFGFFGGDATLSVIIMSADGSTTLVPQTDMKFRIAGENPNPAICEAYINSVCGPFWYLYAIAKWETQDEGAPPPPNSHTHYNHFLNQGAQHSQAPGKEGKPNWNNDTTFYSNGTIKADAKGSGGYGLFQLTYQSDDPNFIEDRGWIWNYQSNTLQAIAELTQMKTPIATSLYNWLINDVSSSLQSQSCPTSGNNKGAFNAYDGTLIAVYNGNSGFTKVVGNDGHTRYSPWKISKGVWTFTGTYTINVATELN